MKKFKIGDKVEIFNTDGMYLRLRRQDRALNCKGVIIDFMEALENLEYTVQTESGIVWYCSERNLKLI